MKKIFTIVCSIFVISAFAQTENVLTITLQQAKDLGLKNRYDSQVNQYDVAVAENNISRIKNDRLPELNAVGNIRYNSQLQATMIPAGFGGLSEPQLFALGAKNVSIFGLELNQLIYKPTIATDIKIAKNNVAMQKERNQQYEITIKTQIAQAYLNVQLKELQLKFAGDDEERYKDYYGVAEATFKLGSALENDLLKAKLDYENAKAETEKEKQQYALAMSYLKYQMNVPAITSIVLIDSLLKNEERIQAVVNTHEINRTEIKQLQWQQENNRFQTDKIYQSNWPTLSLFANYSQQFLNTGFDYTNGKWWTPFSYFGLKVNVPISGIYKSKSSLNEYQLKSLQTNWQLQQKTADINYEVQNAVTTLNNALQNIQTTKRNYELSRTIYQTQQQQNQLGTLLYRNLLDTEKALSTAEQNYVKAVYDYLVAKINYQKSYGDL